MDLDQPTMSLILSTVSVIAAVVMGMVWRINRSEQGPALWAVGSMIVAFGFIPLWFGDHLGSKAIFANNAAALIAGLLLLEGILRFRGLGNERRRLPWYGLYIAVVLFLLYLSLDHHQLRYLILDANLAIILAVTAICLMWRSEELERLIYGITAFFFMLMVLALAYRWGFAAMGTIGVDDNYNRATGAITFMFIPWTLGWTYGLAMAANLRAQRRIEHIAQHDPLTGLPNRRRLNDNLQRLASRLKCNQKKGEPGFGLVIIDVNGFKKINDTYGHAFGDAALVKLAELLVSCLRPADEVIRLGGDEFVVLLRELRDREALDGLCQRFSETLEVPAQIRGHGVRFVISIGAALCPDDSVEPDCLLALADQRMYADKIQKGEDSEVWCLQCLQGA
ncbi:hypothetical protein CKO15_13105 [Halorhodospira abdelmalekii]|uniref:GGDEF domain-containing protein n=1 Tax=Halorhodospira abdelmalekii TaxID=421629 RepID=UPI001906BB06|nr:GGDEF domain-containing protein [Halorhodospira abdelmalekii]MBK1736190.1 hypothetical protein [Halorhodospira abdelmalekii]